MADTLKVVRVFLASPGDLTEERKLAKTTVEDLNKLWCEYLGYHVELVGWEDTVAGFGRAQEIINQDVERCELFVGMLWKRWGTPPKKGGPYGSGFEEEFEISLARRKASVRPEISVFFKLVDPDQLRDPGPELQKVIAFKNRLSDENLVLYEPFQDSSDFARKLGRCIARYVQRLHGAEQAQSVEGEQSLPALAAVDQTLSSSASASTGAGPTTKRRFTFVRDLMDGLERETVKPAPEAIARLRLVSSVLGEHGNDEKYLGVHDANLLFEARRTIDFDNAEVSRLLETGCESVKSENVPLWHWLKRIDGFNKPLLQLHTMFGAEEKRIGALVAMKLVGELIVENDGLPRAAYLNSWLAEDSSAPIRSAALEYLGEWGDISDLQEIGAEVERARYQTVNGAVDAYLRISLRQSRAGGVKALYELQPSTVRRKLIGEIFGDGSEISDETLLQGLNHKSADVRRTTSRLLNDRKALTIDVAERLLLDSNAFVRFEALKALEFARGPYEEERVRQILIRPAALAIPDNAFSSSDPDGERIHTEHTRGKLRARSEHELEEIAAAETPLDMKAWFVLAERRFDKFGQEVRTLVQDEAKQAVERWLQDAAEKYSERNPSLVDKMRRLREHVQKELVREALEVLCRAGDHRDLGLVRSGMQSEFSTYSASAIEFMRKFGEWEDVLLISQAVDKREGRRSLLNWYDDDGRNTAAARAIYGLGRDRLQAILELEAPTDLRTAILFAIPDRSFRQITNSALRSLLAIYSDAQRRILVLRCIKTFPTKRLVKLLDDYMKAANRFYNVIHWLDFATAVPHARAVGAATRLLKELEVEHSAK